MPTTNGIPRKYAVLMAPGVFVALFALVSIALPVGSDGLGSAARTPLSVWARDIHDGFWTQASATLTGCSRYMHESTAVSQERAQARRYCRLGEGDRALAIYRRIGLSGDDHYLWMLNDRLLQLRRWDEAERTAIGSDALSPGSPFRNNLAWHYTQENMRVAESLDLALAAVADGRTAYNVDTLAWAYYRDGQPEVARRVAGEAINFSGPWSGSDAESVASSQRLLALLDAAR